MQNKQQRRERFKALYGDSIELVFIVDNKKDKAFVREISSYVAEKMTEGQWATNIFRNN